MFVGGPRQLAQPVIGLVHIEGDRLGRFTLGESDVEHDEPPDFDLACEPAFNQVAQSGIRFDAYDARAFQQIIFDVVAIVHSEVVDQSLSHQPLVTTA